MKEDTEAVINGFLKLKLDEKNLESVMNAQSKARFLHDAKVVDSVSGLVEKYVELGFEGVPENLKSRMKDVCRTLVYYGLLTHIMLYINEHRLKYKLDGEDFYNRWSVKSIIEGNISSYTKANQDYPYAIFNSYYRTDGEPLLKQMGMGWWRRMRGRAKIHFFYTSGVTFGMMYDLEMSKLSKK